MGFKDENEARVIRVSSAIDLDMTRAAEEIARLVKAAVGKTVAEQTMPALAQIHEAVRGLANLIIVVADQLDQEQTVDTLAAHLPTNIHTSLGTQVPATTLAKAQAARLLAAGFVLVRTGAGHPKQADQPQSVYSDLAVRQAVQQDIARHGADQRLAQATRDGVDDSWHEEP